MNHPKHYMYRAAVVRLVDTLYYETGNARRSHIRVYSQLIRRLCGIGRDTFRNYLHYPASDFDGYELPPDLVSLLRLYVAAHKVLPQAESARYLQELAERSVLAARSVRKHTPLLTADKLIECLQAMEIRR